MSPDYERAAMVLLRAAQNYANAKTEGEAIRARAYLTGVATALHSQGIGSRWTQLVEASKKHLAGLDGPWYGGEQVVYDFVWTLERLSESNEEEAQ